MPTLIHKQTWSWRALGLFDDAPRERQDPYRNSRLMPALRRTEI